MDRGRRAEPYSNATIWTREVARNFAGHLDRLSKVHSCVDTATPKSSHLPQFKHGHHKRVGHVSPIELPHPSPASSLSRDNEAEDHHAHNTAAPRNERGDDESADREADPRSPISSSGKIQHTKALKKIRAVSKRAQRELEWQQSIAHENQRLHERIAALASTVAHDSVHQYDHSPVKKTQDYHKRKEQQKIWLENQAIAKRLRNTKPTISSKDWEKDDKWNQQFLKAHERHRQALQQEMARTLASPHSALIRVKHVGSSAIESSSHRRPVSDPQSDDEETKSPLTAIEVTTAAETKQSVLRDLRRRRSSGDEASAEKRRHSTAANHRRILELRKQKELQLSPPSECDGPTDELVSVRFTFSRGGTRTECCTPNGITGRFSPAVELEAALESVLAVDNEFISVPVLESPHTSRLDDTTEVELHRVVFDVLQLCIDRLVQEEELRPVAPHIESLKHNQQLPQVDETSRVVEASVSWIYERGDTIQENDLPPDRHDGDGSVIGVVPEHQETGVETVSVQAFMDAPSHDNTPPVDQEASGYGSEFDADDDQEAERAAADEYSPDDNNDELNEPSGAFHIDTEKQDDGDEYENDLEDEGGDEDQAEEQSYSEDGFTPRNSDTCTDI